MVRWNKQFKLFIVLLLGLTSMTQFACASFYPGCHKLYHQAVEESRSSGCPLLLIFAGPDWDEPSMKLHREWNESPHIVEDLCNDFVVLRLDFLKHKWQDAWLQKHNLDAKIKHGVEQLPCIILLSPDGEEIRRMTGYEFESLFHMSSTLIHIMESNYLLSDKATVISSLSEAELEQLYKLAEEVSNTKFMSLALEQGVEQDSLFFLQEKFRILVENGKLETEECQQVKARLLAKDPNNEQMVHYTVALLEFQGLSQLWKQGALSESSQVIAPLEEYLSSSFGQEDKENQWRIEMLMAQFFLDFDHWNRALEHATAALEAAPNEMHPDISRSLNYIRRQS